MRKVIGILLTSVMILTLAAGFCLAGEKATTHSITLFNGGKVGGTQLKAGDYKIQVTDNEVVFLQGKKEVARSAAKIENAKEKNSRPSVRLDGDTITEIRPAGTTMIVILSGGKTDKTGM